MSRLICGFGINDADYPVKPRTAGVQTTCKFYETWKSMIYRCYSKREHKRHPTYIGCEVCEDWRYFSKFKRWMEQQDWKGKHLDKDILSKSGKIYSPETCSFIDPLTNNFITDSKKRRGQFMLGVSRRIGAKLYESRCSNPFTSKVEFLGSFATEREAHCVWRHRKHEISCELSELQSDTRIKEALKIRYIPN